METVDRLRFAKHGSKELNVEIARFLGIPVSDWTQRETSSVELLQQIPGWRQLRFAVQHDGLVLVTLEGPDGEIISALGRTFALAMCGAVIEVVLLKQAEIEALYQKAA